MPVNEINIITQQMYKRLIDSSPGELIPYDEFRKLTGLDPQDDGYSYLYSARSRALNEDGIVTQAIDNEGIHVLTDEEIAMSRGNKSVSRIRNISRRARRELASVKNFSALSNEAKVAHNTGLSFLGVFLHLTKPKNIRRLEGEIRESKKALDLEPTLKLFEHK